jgi:hypothetical protein
LNAAALNAAPKRAFAELTRDEFRTMRAGAWFASLPAQSKGQEAREEAADDHIFAGLQAFAAPVSETLEIGYTNYRGEWSMRRIEPVRLWVGSTDWHPEPGLLLEAIDLDKNETRHFAVKDFGPKRKAAPVASQASINALDDDSLYGLFVECGYVGDDPEAVATTMKEGIVRLLGEASPAPVAPAWQGIESAPKDTLVKVRPVREGCDAPYEFARLRPKNDPRWRAVTDNAPLRPTEWCAVEVASKTMTLGETVLETAKRVGNSRFWHAVQSAAERAGKAQLEASMHAPKQIEEMRCAGSAAWVATFAKELSAHLDAAPETQGGREDA